MPAKKKPIKKGKTMKELTQNYKEFEERNETKEITKGDFNKVLKKVVKKKDN